MISVIVPSRQRPELLKRSIGSLGEGDLEILVALDDDDPRLGDYAGIGTSVIGPRRGYGSLHHYYNDLARRARGEWLFLWNDDCIMQTADWIEIVRSYDRQMIVLNPNTNHDNWEIDMNVFPIFPRELVELIGHVSLCNHNDSWIEFVARDAGIMTQVPIMITHDRADLTGNNDDVTYGERELGYEIFHSEEMQRERAGDVVALQAHLRRTGQLAVG